MNLKENLKKVWKYANQQPKSSSLHEDNLKKLRPGVILDIYDKEDKCSLNFIREQGYIIDGLKKIEICKQGQLLDNYPLPCGVILKLDHQNKINSIEINGDVLPSIYKLNDMQLYKKANKLPKIIFIIIVIYIFYNLISIMFNAS